MCLVQLSCLPAGFEGGSNAAAEAMINADAAGIRLDEEAGTVVSRERFTKTEDHVRSWVSVSPRFHHPSSALTPILLHAQQGLQEVPAKKFERLLSHD